MDRERLRRQTREAQPRHPREESPSTAIVGRTSRHLGAALTRHALCRHLPALAGFTLAALVLTYPTALRAGDSVRDSGDPMEYAWLVGYVAHALVTNPLHVFDANVFYPFPASLAFSDSSLGIAVLVAPIVWLTGNSVLAYNVSLLASFAIGGFGCYLLVTSLTRSRLAGLAAGAVYAFCPFRFDRLGQIPNFSDQWIPLTLYALERYRTSAAWRWAAAFAAFFAMQVASSFAYAYAISFAVALYALIHVLREPRSWLALRFAAPLALALAGVGIVAALIAIPYFQVNRYYGFQRDIAEAHIFAARPLDFVSTPRESLVYGQTPLSADRPGPKLFPGAIALVLAALGLARGRADRLVWACVAGAGALLALGPGLHLTRDGPAVALPITLPYQWLYDLLPGFQSLRVPSRFAVLMMLGTASLAGLGTAALAGGATSRRRLAVGAVVGAIWVESIAVPLPASTVPAGASIPEIYRWLAAQPAPRSVVELPLEPNPFVDAPWAYLSTYHRSRLVNGARSFVPVEHLEIAARLRSFPSEPSVATLRALGVDYAVLHTSKYEAADAKARVRRASDFAGDLALATTSGEAQVWSVAAPPDGAIGLVPPCRQEATGAAHALAVSHGQAVPADGIAVETTWRSLGGSIVLVERSHANWIRGDGLPAVARVPLMGPGAAGTYVVSQRVVSPSGVTVIGGDSYLMDGTDGQCPATLPLRLVGYQLPRRDYRPGETVPLRVELEALGDFTSSAQPFANAFDTGFRVFGTANPPAPAAHAWRAGERLTIDVPVSIRADAPRAPLTLEFGLRGASSGERLAVLDPDSRPIAQAVAGRVLVTSIPLLPRADSAGRVPLARLDDGVVFFGARDVSAGPESSLQLTLLWGADSAPRADYTRFAHVLDSAGKLVAQSDAPPLAGEAPTSLWDSAIVVPDSVSIALPANLPSGDYTLAVGMYDATTLRRLAIATGGDSVQIAKLKVSPGIPISLDLVPAP